MPLDSLVLTLEYPSRSVDRQAGQRDGVITATGLFLVFAPIDLPARRGKAVVVMKLPPYAIQRIVTRRNSSPVNQKMCSSTESIQEREISPQEGLRIQKHCRVFEFCRNHIKRVALGFHLASMERRTSNRQSDNYDFDESK